MITKDEALTLIEQELEGKPELYTEDNVLNLTIKLRANLNQLLPLTIGECMQLVVEYRAYAKN